MVTTATIMRLLVFAPNVERRLKSMTYKSVQHSVTHAERKLLPLHYHGHDKRWIVEMMGSLPRQYRQKAIDRYSDVYKYSYDNCGSEIRRECFARREANTILRLFIERVKRAGDVMQPPTI